MGFLLLGIWVIILAVTCSPEIALAGYGITYCMLMI